MSLRTPNRTAQLGVFKTGTPAYLVVTDSSEVVPGMMLFTDAASSGGWADGDVVGVFARKDAANYIVGIGTWDSTNMYLELDTIEETIGTIADDDTVTVYAVITDSVFRTANAQPPTATFIVDTGTSRTLNVADAGAVLCFTSASGVTVTIDDALPVGFHCVLIQEGVGEVSIQKSGTDTLNGGAATIAIADQYKNCYIYQRTEGAWIALA